MRKANPSVDNLIPYSDLHIASRGFLLAMKAEGKRPRTLEVYGEAIHLLSGYALQMGFPDDVSSLTAEHLRHFLASLHDRGLAPASVSVYQRALRRLFAWLVHEGEIRENPMARIEAVKVPDKEVPTFTAAELRRLLRTCRTLRDRALLSWFIETGCRLSEVTGLLLEDIDFERETVMVRGKGGAERIIRPGASALVCLERYMRRERPRVGLHVFLTSKRPHVPLRPNAVQWWLARLGRVAGVAHVHAHRFRHTKATWLMRQGVRQDEVQYLMGWRTSDMVRRYTGTELRERALETPHSLLGTL